MNPVLQGVKSYFTKSPFTTLQELHNMSKFGSTGENDGKNGFIAIAVIVVTILMLTFLILGYFAVGHICKDNTDRGKNTRLGLYALLLLTGGQVGVIYILLWVVGLNICA